MACLCLYVPADRTHVVARKDSNLAGVHGRSFKPAVLTALQHQEHLALSQLQLILLTRGVREHRDVPESHTYQSFYYYIDSKLHCK